MAILPYRTLLNLSGGIDSVYCLWQYAREESPLLIHHCNLKNWTGRAEYEMKAVSDILAWIKRHLPFDFYLIETGYDYGNMPIVQDKEVIAFMNGVLLRSNHMIREIIISSNKGDVEKIEYYIDSEADRHRLIEGVGRRRIKYIYPIAHLTKEEMMREMPPDLLRLTWWCRTPCDGRPCGSCNTCKEVLPVYEDIISGASVAST